MLFRLLLVRALEQSRELGVTAKRIEIGVVGHLVPEVVTGFVRPVKPLECFIEVAGSRGAADL